MGKDEQTLELVAAIALVVLGSTWLGWGAPAEAGEPERSEERASPSLDPTDLEAYLDGVMAVHLRERHIAAAVVTVVQRGEVLVSKGYGFADRERRIAVDPDVTLFRQGSISKLFTWTAVMQLAEQGKLDLHADVNDYLASFKLPATYPQPITLEHLLTHTAGFEGEAGLGYILVRDASELVPLEDSLAAHIPARVRPPGEEPMYSNWGASLAGLIVARVSGLLFEDYVDQYIFRPLAMSSSTFVEPLPKGLAEDLAVGYEWKAGVFQPVPFEYIGNFAPGGSLTASSTDMARFMVAHLQLGRFQESRILSEESARAMQRRAFAFHPSLPGMAYGFYEMDMKGQRIIGHSGDTQAFHSDLALFPDAGLGLHVSYVANGSKARRQLLDAFIDRYLSKPESRKSAPSGKLPSPERPRPSMQPSRCVESYPDAAGCRSRARTTMG